MKRKCVEWWVATTCAELPWPGELWDGPFEVTSAARKRLRDDHGNGKGADSRFHLCRVTYESDPQKPRRKRGRR